MLNNYCCIHVYVHLLSNVWLLSTATSYKPDHYRDGGPELTLCGHLITHHCVMSAAEFLEANVWFRAIFGLPYLFSLVKLIPNSSYTVFVPLWLGWFLPGVVSVQFCLPPVNMHLAGDIIKLRDTVMISTAKYCLITNYLQAGQTQHNTGVHSWREVLGLGGASGTPNKAEAGRQEVAAWLGLGLGRITSWVEWQ